MLPDLGIFEKNFRKQFMVLLSSMGLLESLVASYQHLSLFYLTGSDGIDGVSMEEVECRLFGPNCCKIKDWIHRCILIFTTDQVSA